MRLIGTVLIWLPVFTFILNRRKNADLLRPVNILTLLYIIEIALPMLVYTVPSNADGISNSYLKTAMKSDKYFLVYALLQMLSFYLVLFGTKCVVRKRRVKFVLSKNTAAFSRMPDELSEEAANTKRNKIFLLWGIAFYVIGFAAFVLMMLQIGGIYYFLTHLQYRISLTRDMDLYTWLIPFMHYGVLLIVYSFKGTSRKLGIPLIAFTLVTGLMCGLGGRKTAIMMLIEIVMIYHYTVKPLKLKELLRVRNIIIIAVFYLMFILVVQFRADGAFESFLTDPLSFLSGSKGLLQTVASESYVSLYVTIVAYFSNHSFWYGATFKGLLTAFVPSSLYSGKPPVDDGMYLYSICQGRSNISPVMPTSQLDGSSYPLETFGSMYANFGIIGLIIGMVILGMIVSAVYRRMLNSNYSLFWIVIYTQIVMSFELSTLRIVQLLQWMIVFGCVVFVSERIRLRREEQSMTKDIGFDENLRGGVNDLIFIPAFAAGA